MEDSQIIDLYWQKNADAIYETANKYGAYCFRIAHNILRGIEDSEECVNDTWLRAWNAMPPQRPAALRMFLARITRDLSFDRFRARKADKRGGGLFVPIFLSYRGGFYGLVDTDQTDSPRFALSEMTDRRFNTHYTYQVYLVENHPDRIAILINGMEIYEKIFDVTFSIDGTDYAIAYSPVMNADYGLGDAVLETGDYTVYEAVKLQGEPARTTEYIVDILPLLRRERPDLFDGSDLEPGGDYADQWQLARPLK